MKKFIFYVLTGITFTACGQVDCNKLQQNFKSYQEAKSKISNTKFAITETVNTSRSSWVRSASFYSCDKKYGYFIILTDKGNYIYKNLPINIWNGFKNASSFGRFYDLNIKYRYQLYLSN